MARAKKEGLTGAQVRKRFGISLLTFYRWRGPVRRRRRAIGRAVVRRAVVRRTVGARLVAEATIRAEIRAQVRRLLPQIVREEVAAALKG